MGSRQYRRHPAATSSAADEFRTHDVAGDESADFSGDIRDAVSRARAAAGGKNVVLFGADVARQSLEAGLVGEILVRVGPFCSATESGSSGVPADDGLT
jgi:dihydrofolate reductase